MADGVRKVATSGRNVVAQHAKGARCSTLGARCSVPGARCPVLGARQPTDCRLMKPVSAR